MVSTDGGLYVGDMTAAGDKGFESAAGAGMVREPCLSPVEPRLDVKQTRPAHFVTQRSHGVAVIANKE
jgi:hypothetical protein